MKIDLNEKWTIKTAKELYTYTSGISKGSQFFGTGYPYLTFTEIFHNYFVPEVLTSLVQSNERERENCSIKRGDVFLTRTSETDDELGMSCVALKDYPNATFNGFTKRLRPLTDEVVPEYAGFYFRSPIFRAAVTSMSSIITRASLNEKMLDKLPICYPSKATQQKIASILSAYDNLIQNYKKQIQALQTAASELYKEWFVRFRFPGYQNAKFENGIPEGWKVARLKDIAKDVGKTITKNEINYEKDVYIPIDCIPNHNMALTEVSDIENAESSLQRFESGDILFGAMRVYFHKVILAPMQGVTRKTCFVIHAKKDIFHNYLYSLLFSNTTINYANTISVGATMPYVRWNDFIRMQCLFPSEKILNDYNKIISPIFKTIMNSYKYLSNLTQQRDLLLPRLMSGKLEVK